MGARSISVDKAEQCMKAAELLGAKVTARGLWEEVDELDVFEAKRCPVLKIEQGVVTLLVDGQEARCRPWQNPDPIRWELT